MKTYKEMTLREKAEKYEAFLERQRVASRKRYKAFHEAYKRVHKKKRKSSKASSRKSSSR